MDNNIHANHRQRMREKCVSKGFNTLTDRETLEMILYRSLPRKDTNDVARSLLNHFGSISNVFDADYDELISVNGVGDAVACDIKIISVVIAKYMISKYEKKQTLASFRDVINYLIPRYIDKRSECASVLLLDGKCNVLKWVELMNGSESTVAFDAKKIVSSCAACNASQVIMCHNHPSGITKPSENDIAITKKLCNALSYFDIELIDHIILAEGDFYSMRNDSDYSELFTAAIMK